MDATAYVVLLLSLLFVAFVSQRIEGTSLTVPMLCVGLGLLIGPIGLGFVDVGTGNGVVRVITELTLILVLAADASRIKLRQLRQDHSLPARLLGIGLPLTIVLGAFLAALIFDFVSFWEAAILAVILTPTDASLGQAVVSNPRVPLRIRQTLNVESGLNDGIAMPFLLLAISLALAENPASGGLFDWLLWAAREIVFGTLVGIAVGFAGFKLTEVSWRAGWIAPSYGKIVAVALPLLAYGFANLVHGNGYVAAFVLGATIGNIRSAPSQSTLDRRSLYEHIEVEVELLIVLTFLIFGAVLLPPALQMVTWPMVLYALLSLTIVRMLPVALSLIGTRVQPATTLFVGWFGPRGLASILYIYTVLEAENIAGANLIFGATMVTVLISVLVHGLTAAPAARRYGRIMEQHADEGVQIEMQEVSALPLRRPLSESS